MKESRISSIRVVATPSCIALFHHCWGVGVAKWVGWVGLGNGLGWVWVRMGLG
ncbi:hypothetical protein HanPI659440_Chr16g0652031 [Helianthus annuus]|nr:hypothetical protein HanPI659440_Chr16g0652031 [Helianthus annuus]